ncbi:hypothetical protein [Rhizobium leguminosarum]
MEQPKNRNARAESKKVVVSLAKGWGPQSNQKYRPAPRLETNPQTLFIDTLYPYRPADARSASIGNAHSSLGLRRKFFTSNRTPNGHRMIEAANHLLDDVNRADHRARAVSEEGDPLHPSSAKKRLIHRLPDMGVRGIDLSITDLQSIDDDTKVRATFVQEYAQASAARW